jgi:hypothetical protein
MIGAGMAVTKRWAKVPLFGRKEKSEEFDVINHIRRIQHLINE